MFQPIEITDDAATMYERTRPVDTKLESVIVKLPALNKDEVQVNDIKHIMDKIKSNYDMAFKQKPKTSDKNWYNVVNLIKNYVVKAHLDSDGDTRLKKYVIYHNLDSLGLFDTLMIMNNMSTYKTDPEIDPIVRQYFREKTIASNDGHQGIVLSKEDKPYKFYTQSPEGTWEPASLSETHALMLSKEYSTKYVIVKKRLNKIFGFMSWVPIMDESVFKMRDIDSTVNTTGARADQAPVKDLILKINTILGKEKFYTEDNVKSADSIGEGKNRLVVLAELLLRYNNDTDIKDLKVWFLNGEQMDINSIQNIGKKKK